MMLSNRGGRPRKRRSCRHWTRCQRRMDPRIDKVSPGGGDVVHAPSLVWLRYWLLGQTALVVLLHLLSIVDGGWEYWMFFFPYHYLYALGVYLWVWRGVVWASLVACVLSIPGFWVQAVMILLPGFLYGDVDGHETAFWMWMVAGVGLILQPI